ncbi:putative receptor-like protein kinase [Canna indica]|uniref:Receptor-like protein kinase n=1 Tax=Canna indica TaxID=4628 RepID=A0AAQ3KN51_9LILI|nr:putative receptor-like protein kinase [Canna indica]
MKFFYGLLLVFLGSLCAAKVHALMKPILISCGSNSSIVADGRHWIGDSTPGENFTLSSSGFIASASMINVEPIYATLYKNARIFNTSTSYNFTLLPGNYYIRFHFYPSRFDTFDVNESSFDVIANNLKLVSKFNVPGEIYWKNTRSNSNITTLVKEYLLNISLNELKIEFIPESGSFAFINAVEVIPILDKLLSTESVSKVGGSTSKFPLSLSGRGIETMYRLNVGGPEIKPSDDKDFWRKWDSDERFMFSVNAAYSINNTSNVSFASINDTSTAPILVYETARTMTDNQVVEKRFNVSWKFEVDPNFDYLIRLHFCELVYDKPNQRIFRIYINNKTAAENYDVFVQAGGKNKAYHEDYFEAISQKVDTLWIQLGSDSLTSASGTDALLNGVEIFKLSRNGVLAHAPEKINIMQEGGGSIIQKPKYKILWAAIGVGVCLSISGLLLCIAFMCYRIHQKRSLQSPEKRSPVWRSLPFHGTIESTTKAYAKSPSSKNGASALNRIGRRFTVSEIRAATKNFDDSLLIGTGGFGKVYKGELDEGITVAIKRANPQSEQGLKEFETEIEMLSKLRHRHLVSMIGYCDEQKEMILVYEYMANGTLRSHLFGSDLPPLAWKQRLEACIGAARGLHYLHTGAEGGIIHRDVKTTNILLDENFVAKMADFGLSKDGPAFDQTHVSTAVKGSFGYLDPEYFRRQQLTDKSDVYSFGVVLFEVACARSVINPSLPREEINLAEWALRWQRKNSIERILDRRLEGDYSPESMKKFAEIAEKCLADEGRNRPTMGEVLWHLENVLQMHEAHVQSRSLSCCSSSPSPSGSEKRYGDASFSLPRIVEGEEEEAIREV